MRPHVCWGIPRCATVATSPMKAPPSTAPSSGDALLLAEFCPSVAGHHVPPHELAAATALHDRPFPGRPRRANSVVALAPVAQDGRFLARRRPPLSCSTLEIAANRISAGCPQSNARTGLAANSPAASDSSPTWSVLARWGIHWHACGDSCPLRAGGLSPGRSALVAYTCAAPRGGPGTRLPLGCS